MSKRELVMNRLVKYVTVTIFNISNRLGLAHLTNAAIPFKFSRFVFILFTFSLLSACGAGGQLGGEEGQPDPIVVENPIVFIKRPPLAEDDETQDDLTEPQLFKPGAVLYIKNSALPSATVNDISSSAFSDPSFLNEDGELLYDVKDVSASYDGKKLIFAMRAPEIEDADDEDQPKWNIWEYDHETNVLRRIITGNDTAESGHDISPSYLPDGRVLFTSTRQRRSKSMMLDEGKGSYSGLDEELNTEAFVLHAMEDDGSNIVQLTFNQSHDLNPTVLSSGKILFSRWDNAGQTSANGLNLYQINPDGSGMEFLYGRHSHDSGDAGLTVQFFKPRELENGNILIQMREFEADTFASVPIEIKINDFTEESVAISSSYIEGENDSIEVGQAAIVSGLNLLGEQSIKGTYGAIYPLYDGTSRYLVNWSLCRVVVTDTNPDEEGDQAGSPEACTEEKLADEETYSPAELLPGLWVLDAKEQTQLPIDLSDNGQLFDEMLILRERVEPDYIAPATLDAEAQALVKKDLGAIHIRSVYDFAGQDTSPNGLAALSDPLQTAANERPQRFIRIEKPVSIPSDDFYDFDNSGYGRSRAQLMREILGYAPIEPDGSVKVSVPANVAFAISVLDENGRRTSQRHQNWMQVAPGETLQCNGCHTGTSDIPHGRSDAEPDTVNTGAATSELEFPNTHPDLDANIGETMAETYACYYDEETNGVNFNIPDGLDCNPDIPGLSADIIYDDHWSPVVNLDDNFEYAFSDLETQVPINKAICSDSWTSICRILINYESHIHPLWSVDRQQFEADEITLKQDNTCTACHANVDDMDIVMLPEAQLDLTSGPSTEEPLHLKSYRELLFNDNQVEVSNGALIDFLQDTGEVEMENLLDDEGIEVLDDNGDPIEVPRLVPQLDINGDPEFDGDGNPILVTIPIRVTVTVTPSMSVNGALSSSRFLGRFDAGGSHEGYLSSAELKLVSEWLDLGAQYYNYPLDAPLN